MNKQYEQVREVHNAFGQYMPDKPEKMKTGETAYDRLMLKIAAEHLSKECLKMKTHGTASEVMQRASWMLEELVEFMNAEALEDQVDALTDLIYFAIGTFTLMGVKPEPFFDIVHAANMGKLWEDGKPRFDEQGKWIKPEGWAERYAPEPKIVQELMRQSVDA